MELLRGARIRFRSTKQVLLAREQFIKHVWHCTHNGFGARKLPAESSPRPNVLFLSSEMPQGAQTIVCVVDAQSTIFVERKQLAVRDAETTIFVVFGSFRALKPWRASCQTSVLFFWNARMACFCRAKSNVAKIKRVESYVCRFRITK